MKVNNAFNPKSSAPEFRFCEQKEFEHSKAMKKERRETRTPTVPKRMHYQELPNYPQRKEQEDQDHKLSTIQLVF